ncbi:MAG: DNA primase, partial [Alphaproteobacteria bacterium]|nr:DNA primase [Alphaproteobacteria bacterium]
IHFPKGMDANEYALQVKPAAKSLGVVIRSAVWLDKKRSKPPTAGPVTTETTPPSVAEPSLAETDTTPQPDSALSLAADPVPIESLPAAVVPDAPQPDIPAQVTEHEILITLGERRYRIRGLEKNPNLEALKINLLVSAPALDGNGEAIHIDTFDFYQQRPRGAFIKQAAVELGIKEAVIKADLGKLLRKLEALQAQALQVAQAPKEQTVTLNDQETQAALELLQSPDLLERIQADFTRCGVVGEATNKLVGYLATLSRKLDQPLAVTIQSTSAAGKSSLMDAILAFLPEEERIKYSAMTGQSLFYMGETDL